MSEYLYRSMKLEPPHIPLNACPWPGCRSNDVSIEGRGDASNAEHFVRCHSCGMCGPLSCLPGSEVEAALLWNNCPRGGDLRKAIEKAAADFAALEIGEADFAELCRARRNLADMVQAYGARDAYRNCAKQLHNILKSTEGE